jgi:hypothetical protein
MRMVPISGEVSYEPTTKGDSSEPAPQSDNEISSIGSANSSHSTDKKPSSLSSYSLKTTRYQHDLVLVIAFTVSPSSMHESLYHHD